jgi:ABC-type phosphate/phosphonate transport system substrate-binding protein
MEMIKKFVLSVLPLILIICNAFATEKPVLRYGFSTFFSDFDLSYAKGALDLWGKKMGERTGFNSECYILNNINALAEKIKHKEIDIGSALSVEYIQLKKIHDLQPMYAQKNCADPYYIVAKKNQTIKNLSDLKGKRFARYRNDKLGKLYLNTLLLKQFQKEQDTFFSSIIQKKKYSLALYDVFFDKADACMVLKRTYDLLCELNPQIKQDISILHMSEPFIPLVTFCRGDIDQHLKLLFIKAVKNMFDFEEGRQIMLIFNVTDIMDLTDKDLENVTNLIQKYEKLKQ